MTTNVTRRAFLQLAATLIIVPNTPWANAAGPKILSVPVLLYHDISYEHRDEYSLHPRLFAAQMEWLYSNGYRAVSLADLDKPVWPDKAVVITFDDGYASFIPYALPFMQAYGFKATINIIGQHVGSYISEWGVRPMLSWDEYRYLDKTGLVSLGCHTHRLHVFRHSGAAGIPSDMLAKDLQQFQNKTIQEMGKPSDILAWPYGFYNDSTIAIARRAGFRYLLTSSPGKYHPRSGTLEIPRINIPADDKLSTFRTRIEVDG